MTENGLVIEEIYKSYGEIQALDGVSLAIPEGQTLALLGPSGSGKSTLLNLVAGLETPDRGEIRWNGEPLAGVPPYRRGFGLMFQDLVLFPHMNVFDNVAFGLKMAGWGADQIQERVQEVLDLVGLPGFGERDPNTLSGGEQQRIALARSLAPRPRLLMLDEPLGSLDRSLRERLVVDLHAILLATQQTALYVTHDQEEAFLIASQVAVLRAGRLEQVGAPQEIYLHPRSAFIARFLGLTNLIEGQAERVDGQVQIHTALGDLPVDSLAASLPGPLTVLIRPDAARLEGGGLVQVEGRVMETSFLGSLCRAVIETAAGPLRFDFPSRTRLPAPGEPVRLGFDPQEAFQVFPSPQPGYS
jgi:ABC-type Fe3+/spermidine/putrescine transport system ATPase subunit